MLPMFKHFMSIIFDPNIFFRFSFINSFGQGFAMVAIEGGFLVCGGIRNTVGKVGKFQNKVTLKQSVLYPIIKSPETRFSKINRLRPQKGQYFIRTPMMCLNCNKNAQFFNLILVFKLIKLNGQHGGLVPMRSWVLNPAREIIY